LWSSSRLRKTRRRRTALLPVTSPSGIACCIGIHDCRRRIHRSRQLRRTFSGGRGIRGPMDSGWRCGRRP
jgi:hypothetical protein